MYSLLQDIKGVIYVFKRFDELRVLVRNMFLYKRGSFEKLLTRSASEFSLIFLLDMGFDRSRKLPV